MTYTTAHIKRYINGLAEGIIFSTREVLTYGSRAAVDQCLCRMVRQEIIIRLARGLFMRNDIGLRLPDVLTVAVEKAKAFGKQIFTHGLDAAKTLMLTDSGNRETTYLIDGCSSSFRFGQHLIHFKGSSPRKAYLNNTTVGLAIRSLWHLGQYACGTKELEIATQTFGRSERQQLRQSAHIVPAWLNNIINHY